MVIGLTAFRDCGPMDRPSRVHSTNGTCTTSAGVIQRRVVMSSAVMARPMNWRFYWAGSEWTCKRFSVTRPGQSPLMDAASGRRESRLDVVVNAEEVGGIVILLDRCQPQ